MSSWFEPEEPINNSVETVYLGRLFSPRADVTLTYNSASGRFAVQNGRISEKTTQHGISTTLTIVSNGGRRFNVTRRRGGVYLNNLWWTWIAVE